MTNTAQVLPPPASTRGDTFLRTIVERLVRRGPLTPRMAEALELYVHGWPPDAAARQMQCSLNTYRNHMAAAFRRIGAEAPNEVFRVLACDLDERPVPLEFEPDRWSTDA